MIIRVKTDEPFKPAPPKNKKNRKSDTVCTDRKKSKPAVRGIKESRVDMRVEPGLLEAFRAWCDVKGMTVSEALRDYMREKVR